MAAATPDKSAKTSAKPSAKTAKTAKRGSKTSKKAAKTARKAKPVAADKAADEPAEEGVGAAGVEAPELHPTEPVVEEDEEANMADEPETPPEPTPEPDLPAPVPEGAGWAEQVASARAPPVHLDEPEGNGSDGMGAAGTATVTLTEKTPPAEEASEGMDELGDNPVHLDVGEGEEAEAEASTSRPATVVQSRGELGIPEQFLTIAIDGQWDDRMERVKPGRMGAALVGSVLLELAVHGKLQVRRDHFVVEDAPTGDAELDAFAAQVKALGPIPTAQVMRKMGRKLTERIRPWKGRAERRGWLREERRKFLGLFKRSTTYVLDADAQGKLQNRLVRMLAGGGNPDVKSIALLGLIQAAGLLPQMVPSSALAFNEKRISLLLSGRDPLHYRVDTSVAKVQDACLRTILADVRKLR